jgi:hypothetical protein
MRRPRICLTPEEERLLLAKFHQLRKTLPDNLQNTFTKSQIVLPFERRRNPITPTQCSKLHAKYKSIIDSGHVRVLEEITFPSLTQTATPASAAPAPPNPVENGVHAASSSPPPATESENNLPEILVIEKKVIVKEQPDYGRIPTSTLARILIERLVHLEETEAALLNMTKAFEAKRQLEIAYDRSLDPRPLAAQPKQEPLRITIIGLLPNQVNEIQARTAQVARPVKFQFLETNKNQPISDYADFVICSKFVNHKWTEKARSILPHDCVFFMDGGVESIIQKVYDLASRQSAPLTPAQARPYVLR